MKKVKLSTALLVILMGTTITPIVSTAESIDERIGTEKTSTSEKQIEEVSTTEETTETATTESSTKESSDETIDTTDNTSESSTEKSKETSTTENSTSASTETTKEKLTEEEANDETLDEAKEWAIDQINYWKEIGFITDTEYNRLILGVNNAMTVDEVYNVIDSVEFVLEAVKKDAKNEIENWYSIGYIEKAEYDRLNAAIDAAKTVDEIDQIMSSVNWNEKLIKAKENAFEEIETAFEKGLITNDEYDSFIMDIINATSVEAVNEIMARFRAHIVNPTIILNTSNLSKTILEAKLLKEINYTKESWAIFAAALSSSEELLAATEVRMMNHITQAQIDQSTANLKAAMAQLVAINPEAVINPVQTISTATETAKVNPTNLPKTGEKENQLMALYGMMMSGVAALFIAKKRKEDKEFL